jgi:hypothetical protein
MATFYVVSKIELIILVHKFGISHVIKKCLCAMFNFHPITMHVKDNAYNVNNNVIKSIFQVLVIGDLGLEWRLNVKRFKIIVENLSKSYHNIIFMPKIVAFVANGIMHLMEIKQGILPNHVDL